MADEPTHLQARIDALCYDANDPAALAAWWQRLAGGEVDVEDDDGEQVARWTMPDSTPVDFLPVPEAKAGKGRLHLDVRATDFDAAVERALALGATKADDVYDGPRWQVLRDPEGNEFCILRPPRD